ncbi:hypothetical protein [Aliikangiella coralliicola]|uniref:Uncharacterized protein n=1 Tax=Aliikangiella coralliicola TaxID=2592383 RepID=A0A545UC71_9GAMM|nr:hypothetical protein [Aliikangiella coralliicola]TQV87060.1 hypothetical protein FLL46_14740 [Aliikangiella coralliicola]
MNILSYSILKSLIKMMMMLILICFNVRAEESLFVVDLKAALEIANDPKHTLNSFARNGAGLSSVRGIVTTPEGGLLIIGSHTPGAIPLDLNSIKIAFESRAGSGFKAPSVSIEPGHDDSVFVAGTHHYFKYNGPPSADNSFARLVTASLDVQLKLQKALKDQVQEVDFEKQIRKFSLAHDCKINSSTFSNMFHAVAAANVAKNNDILILREPATIRVVSGQSGEGDFFQDFLHQCKKIPYTTLYQLIHIDYDFLLQFDDRLAMYERLSREVKVIPDEYRASVLEAADIIYQQIVRERQHSVFNFIRPGRSSSEAMANAVNSEIDQMLQSRTPAELSFFQRMAGLIAVFNELDEKALSSELISSLNQFSANYYQQPSSVCPIRTSIPGLAVNLTLLGGLRVQPITYELAELGSLRDMKKVVLAHQSREKSLIFSLGRLSGELPRDNKSLINYLVRSLKERPPLPLFIEELMDERGHVDFSRKKIGDKIAPWKTSFDEESDFSGQDSSLVVSVTSNNYNPEYLLYNAPIDEIARLQYSRTWFKIWNNRLEAGIGAEGFMRLMEVSDTYLPGLVDYHEDVLAGINLYSRYLLPLAPDGTNFLFDAQYRPEPVELYSSQQQDDVDNAFRRDTPARTTQPSASLAAGVSFNLPITDSMNFSTSARLAKLESRYQYFSAGINWPMNKLSFSNLGVSAYYAKQNDRDIEAKGIEFIATNDRGMIVKAGFSIGGDDKQFSTSIIFPIFEPERKGRWSK